MLANLILNLKKIKLENGHAECLEYLILTDRYSQVA